jgi:hypothetical protein
MIYEIIHFDWSPLAHEPLFVNHIFLIFLQFLKGQEISYSVRAEKFHRRKTSFENVAASLTISKPTGWHSLADFPPLLKIKTL